ncbi:MAG: iron ABC transporter permease [Acidimicrobiales bacterium]|nr:iron ABC transporter permease [Acidimicrobiales bacterium]
MTDTDASVGAPSSPRGPGLGSSRPPAPPSELERVAELGRPVLRAPVLIGVLVVALVVLIVLAGAIGAYAIPPLDVVVSVLERTGVSIGTAPTGTAESVLWEIRFPRVALAVVVGAALGCAGAAMQGTFANPLAEPGVVGVSAGAALGAVAAIVVGFTLLGLWSLSVAAFLGGLVTVVAVYLAARSEGRTEVVTLILTGVAVNALAGAVIGLLMYVSTDAELRSITFWQLGSVAQATWPKVAAVAPLAVVGIVMAVGHARGLDLLALGERPARHLGVDVERLRVRMMVIVAVLTAAAVAVSGIVLFVGLVVPHLVRMLAGPGHRALLVASALGGSVVVVAADLVARTVVAPAEIPLGVLTALLGTPFFFWLLRRTRARQGGWA